jgi:hypothetical protein
LRRLPNLYSIRCQKDAEFLSSQSNSFKLTKSLEKKINNTYNNNQTHEKGKSGCRNTRKRYY